MPKQKEKNPVLPEEKALSGQQALKYAEDLSTLYRSEKEKRLQLEVANEKFKKLARDLQATLDQLTVKEALNARLGRILDQTSNEIYIFNAKTLRLIQANLGARQNLGRDEEGMAGLGFYDIMPELSGDPFEELVKPLRSGKETAVVFETENRRKDGTSYPAEVRLQLSRTETPPVFVAVVQDITERKQALNEIHRLQKQLELENAYLREEVKKELAFDQIVGKSPVLQKALRQIEMVAKTDASVLVLGETGTGKELVARAIHERSRRNQRPLVKVNCGAIPRDLFESEFFGHVKGAFTGALKDRTGRFQLADGGTLFLDEVSEIPLELQSKLLRVLQEGQFERVGEDVTREVDVRIISASNRNLKEFIQAGRFREDLYYRLSVVPIEIPPLRERGQDVELLANHFVEMVCQRLGEKKVLLTPDAVKKLMQYDWPGNARELHNVIERAVIISRGGPLDLSMLETAPPARPPASRGAKGAGKTESEFLSDEELDRQQKENIVAALEHTRWKLYGPGGAAELLGLKPTTLAYRMKKFGIVRQYTTKARRHKERTANENTDKPDKTRK